MIHHKQDQRSVFYRVQIRQARLSAFPLIDTPLEYSAFFAFNSVFNVIRDLRIRSRNTVR